MKRSIPDILLFLLVIISATACNHDLPFDLNVIGKNPEQFIEKR